MYLHDYRWSGGFTSQELSVLRKALQFAADENAEELTDEEAAKAGEMARIIGGVYAAKRAERDQRQNGEQDGNRPLPRQRQGVREPHVEYVA